MAKKVELTNQVNDHSLISEERTTFQPVYLVNLPVEILFRIFSFLMYRDRFQLKFVCRRLYDVSSDPHLWKEITWVNYQSDDQPYLKGSLMSNSSFIMKVKVSGNVNIAALATQLISCSNIRTLSLLGNHCTVVAMERIVKCLPLLDHLEFEPCNTACSMERCNHQMCRPNEWRDFLHKSTAMSSLVLVSPWSEHFIEFLWREWSVLKYRPVEFCVSVLANNACISNELSGHCITLLELWKKCQSIFQSCSHTSRFFLNAFHPKSTMHSYPWFELNLSGESPPTPISVSRLGSLGMESDGLIRLCGKPHNSLVYTVGHYIHESQFCLSLNEAKFENIPSCIVTLNLCGASGLVSSQLEAIAARCTGLVQLNLKGCPLSLNPLFGLAAIADKCLWLKALNVQEITSSGVESLIELWYIFSKMKKLTHLALDPCMMRISQEEYLGLDVLSTHDVAEAVNMTNSIISLDVRAQQLQCQLCRSIAIQCPLLTSGLKLLRHLQLDNILPEPCSAIANAALHRCKCLKTLHISTDFSFHL